MNRLYYILLVLLACGSLLNAQYNVNYSTNTNIQSSNPNIIQIGEDEHIKVPIGFPFSCFGNLYDSLWIDFHGYVTFNNENPWFCCDGEAIPSMNTPNNFIAACWTDPSANYDDGNGFFYNEYQYETIGSSPNRIMLITFEFNENCGSSYYYGQIKLFEGTNKIEIHTLEWNWSGNNCQNATQGIENSDGTAGFYYSDRNANSTWQSFGDVVEFTIAIPTDLTIPFANPTVVCSGNNNIGVYIQNVGSEVIDSFDIAWQWDGAYQDSQRVYANIPPSFYHYIILGNKSFGGVGDQHTLKAWTFNPNGQNDNNPSNDTLQNATISSGLTGVYTIGGTNPNYANFNSALSDLYNYGACDTVVFNVRPGNYYEQLIFPSYFPSVFTVFQAENGDSSSVVINHDNANVVSLNNVFNVQFRNLTIKQNQIQWDHLIKINNYCVNIGFEKCLLQAAPIGSLPVISMFEHTGIIRINNNTIKNGSHGIYMNPYTGNTRDNIVINNNHITGFSNNGIYAQNTIGMKIMQNLINTTSFCYEGISCIDDSEIEIHNNFINLSNGCHHGINLQSAGGISTVYNNMLNLNIAGNGTHGIRVRDLLGSGYFKVSHNTIYLHGQNTNTNSNALLVYNGHCDSLINNVFINTASGRAYTLYNNQNSLTDYNVLYSSGSVLANIDNTPYTTISSLNVLNKELHGKQFLPYFYSNTNFHSKDILLNNSGAPHLSVISDYDGESRNLTSPDIGADEFSPPNIDLAPIDVFPKIKFKYGNQPIKIVVHNLGLDTIDNAIIKWSVNNINQPDFEYSGSLSPTQKDTLIIGNYLFNHSTPYTIKTFIHMVNGQIDEYTLNDTLSSDTIYAAIADSWLVGSTGVFQNLTTALNAVKLGGVIDSVKFLIQNGIYHQTIDLPPHFNYSCDQKIIIESESQNNNNVIFDNLAVNDNVLILSGADGFTFRNITFKATSPNYPHAVVINGASTCNTFYHCRFQTSENNNYLVYSNTGSNDKKNAFINNEFGSSGYGIYLNSDDSCTIKNNIFEGQRFNGISVSGINNGVLIEGNTINMDSTNTDPFKYAISVTFSNSKDIFINGNMVHSLNSAYYGSGIYMRGITNGVTKALVSNNFITTKGADACSGIWLDGYFTTLGNVRVVNNSILTGGNNSAGIQVRLNYNTGLEFINNSIFNKFPGTNRSGIRFYSIQNSFNSNYNNIHVPDGMIAIIDGTNYSNLLDWQVTGQDNNSISEDPVYISEFDLHSTSSFLNEAGIPQTNVIKDIDGQSRNNIMPDIGADEFDLVSNDVGLLEINGPSLPFPSGNNFIYIKFQNNGIDTLTSMVVNWKVNGVSQPPHLWTGILPSGETYDSLDIGIYNFPAFTNHSLQIWVSLPNGIVDELNTNDTLYKNNLYPALQGSYTIGGTNPDFVSLKNAIQELNNGGVLGNVTFNIRPGIYEDTLKFSQFIGSGCSNVILFQTETGLREDVVITNLGLDKATIRFNGADGVQLKNLTIKSVNPAYKNVIEINGGAHCNLIENCIIEGLALNGYGGGENESVIVSRSSPSTLDTFNVIANNTIKNGSNGIYFVNGKKTIIENNIFENNFNTSITLQGESQFIVQNNDITQTQNSGSSFNGIEAYWFGGGATISKNKIISTKIRYGINIYNSSGNNINPINVSNNVISNLSGSSNQVESINIYSCSNVNVYHNSIITHSTYYGFGLNLQYNTSLHVKNNISMSSGVIYAANYIGNTAQIINFNNYFHKQLNSTLLISGYNSLSHWKTTTQQDSQSISENPYFLAENNLHTYAVLLNGKGVYINEVNIDIDGEIRNNPPDIGADEFDPLPSDDAGIFMYLGPNAPFDSGIQQVKVALKNYGGNTLDTIHIRWLVNGVEQPSLYWSGELMSGNCDTVVLGNYSFLPYKSHQIIAWTEQPNGVLDSFNYNDTLRIQNIYPALNGYYTVGGLLPDFNTFGQIQEPLKYGGIAGNVVFNIRDGIYPVNFNLDPFPKNNIHHSVTFKSEDNNSNGVILNNTNSVIFNLTNVHNIHVNNIEFNHTGGNGIRLSGGTSNISIDSCKFRGFVYTGATSDNNPNFASIYSLGTREDSILITNSDFFNASFGIYFSGGWSNPEKDNLLQGNNLTGKFYTAIYLGNQQNIKIINNKIDANLTDKAIEMWNMTSVDLSRNKIFARSEVSYTHAVYIWNIWGNPSLKSSISNNYIYSDGKHYQSLLALENYSYIDFYHNTLRSNVATENTRVVVCNSANPVGSFNFKNNILYSHKNARCLDHQNNSSGIEFSHNNFYNHGGPIAIWNGNSFTSIQSMAVATTNHISTQQNPPLFLNETDYKVQQPTLNNSGLNLISIANDIDGLVRNNPPDLGCKEFLLPQHDVGIISVISPQDTCGLSSSEYLTVRIQNFGSNTETGIVASFLVNATTWVSETINVPISAGQSLDYTFTTPYNFIAYGEYNIKVKATLTGDLQPVNDCIEITITNLPPLSNPVTNMIPLSNTENLESTISFSWLPSPGATHYDIYTWKTNENRGMSPDKADLLQINTSLNGFEYGSSYLWQINSKNECGQNIWSDTISFTVRHLPDLILDTVSNPVTGYTGQPIGIEWTAKNIGLGSTLSNIWIDKIYLSTDATFNPSLDVFLGGFINLTSLNENESYAQAKSITLPNNYVGSYYLIIVSDAENSVLETNNSNNYLVSSSQIVIQLSPTPDLRVTMVANPSNAFSGQNTLISYMVKNTGTAQTIPNLWYDQIIFGTDSLNAIGTVVATVQHTGVLPIDSSYHVQRTLSIPPNIFGKYYFHVKTDFNNTVFEYSAETNNSKSGNSINVILEPTADLIPLSSSLPDTLHNNQCLTFSYSIINDGIGTTFSNSNHWADKFYLSISPIFNQNFNQLIALNYIGTPINSLETYTHNPNICVGTNLSGSYYGYIEADAFNNVSEFAGETNNVTKLTGQYYVANPDLVITDITHNPNVIAGNLVSTSIKIKNIGIGHLVNRSLKLNIYISNFSQFNIANAELLASKNQYQSCLRQDSFIINENILIPPQYQGLFYLHIVVDAENSVLESQENNNIFTNSITIYQGNLPDLTLENFILPDTAQAGSYLTISFDLKNIGLEDALPHWNDKIYLSFDSSWNASNAILLHTISNANLLSSMGTKNIQRQILVPETIAENIYYIYIYADKENQIFESTNENNNIKRSNAIYIKKIPPSDLMLMNISINSDTITSGTTQSIVKKYRKNTTALRSYFVLDKIFLSTDTTLQSNDIEIAEHSEYLNGLQNLDTTTITSWLNIPITAEGDYYLIGNTDVAQINNDTNWVNNKNVLRNIGRLPKKIHIDLPMLPDIAVHNYNINNILTTGYASNLNFTIKNQGHAIAASTNYKLLLSTDPLFDNGDFNLYVDLSPELTPGQTSNDYSTFYIPSAFTGNYYLLIILDAENQFYEGAGEQNNLLAISIFITNPPPSDIIVENILSLTDTFVVGLNYSINYQVKNIGSSSAVGLIEDIIYISSDSQWSIDDKIIGSISQYNIIIQNNYLERTVNCFITGVLPGDYYLIVKSDVKQLINEINENNNSNHSITKVHVAYETIQLNIAKTPAIENNEIKYYELSIPANLFGETIKISLSADTTQVFNEIYASHQNIPSRSSYDHCSKIPLERIQQLIINEAIPGKYYIAVYANSLSSTYQNDTIIAKVVDFEFTNVFPKKGVTNTQVTLKIQGTKFFNTPVWRLRRYEPYQYVAAESYIIPDANTAYVTYNLDSIDLDTYNVEAVKADSSMAYIYQGFEVVEEGITDLQLDIEGPGSVSRRQNPLKITIRYINAGNTDIIDPKVLVSAPYNNGLAYTLQDLLSNNTTYQLIVNLKEEGVPLSLLRPNASGTIEVFAWGLPRPSYTVQLIND